MSGTCSSASEYAGTSISLSNPKTCRIDTFMSGKPVCTSAVIAPPWPRVVRGAKRLKTCGSDVPGQPSRKPMAHGSARMRFRAAKNKDLDGRRRGPGIGIKYQHSPDGYGSRSNQGAVEPQTEGQVGSGT